MTTRRVAVMGVLLGAILLAGCTVEDGQAGCTRRSEDRYREATEGLEDKALELWDQAEQDKESHENGSRSRQGLAQDMREVERAFEEIIEELENRTPPKNPQWSRFHHQRQAMLREFSLAAMFAAEHYANGSEEALNRSEDHEEKAWDHLDKSRSLEPEGYLCKEASDPARET